jgi:hypothetical protein
MLNQDGSPSIQHCGFIIQHFPRRYLSVALSVGLPRLDVIQHRALCSSDFPRRAALSDGVGAIASAAGTT